LVACVVGADGEPQLRTFSTMTADLLRLRDWLQAAHCTQVAIECKLSAKWILLAN